LLGLSSATQQRAPFTISSTSQQQQQQQQQQQREASFASHDTYVCSVQTSAAQQPCYVAATGARAVVQQDQQLHCAHSAHSWHGPWNPRQQLHGESLWAIRPDTGSPTSKCLHTVHSYSLTAGRASYSTTSSSSSQLGGPPNGNDDRSSSSRSSSGGSSSVPPSSWLLQHLPASAVPYAQLMRLDKPIGSWLLAWPGLWWVCRVCLLWPPAVHDCCTALPLLPCATAGSVFNSKPVTLPAEAARIRSITQVVCCVVTRL
jgi:hypothetical protein